MQAGKKIYVEKNKNAKGAKEMKKIIALLLVMLFSLTSAYANSITVDVQATIPVGTPEISIGIFKCDGWDPAQRENPWLGQPVSSMDFGELVYRDENGNEVGQWYSRYFHFIAVYTSSFGVRYQVDQRATRLTGGGYEIPIGAFGYVPAYSALDEWSPGNPQGPMPEGAQLSFPMRAAGSAGYIYRSEPAATNRIIRTFYSIPRLNEGGTFPWGGYEQIPLSQPGATYSGTVTLTIVSY